MHMSNISLINLAVLGWFLVVWNGYTFYADHFKRNSRSLLTVMRKHRQGWMQQMLHRDVRIVDTTIMSALMRSVGLFSSTTLLILAGLLAILGSLDKVQALVRDIPYVVIATHAEWELKILVLIVIFVYAFFKFAWSLRQFNYSITLIGAAPPPSQAESSDAQAFAVGAAEVIALAVSNFNRGMRAYYFALAALSWFLHPLLFSVSTLWVVAVVYRREFRSHTLGFLDGIPGTGTQT
ncbi:hypothetical protein BEN30_15155 [Magnetovibrio blakemorei]|uniref:DUF599 domain-containing protein n=2 Tax=Magnetovibrio blakemorei TaxID=28181 RepID=A0A1E5Q4X6_9PROT|nr:hypothetical protein BEN30_15155 [Magnetovibrio blakemorei]